MTANVNKTSDERLNVKNLMPSIIMDVNGTKIGIIGYLTPETMVNYVLSFSEILQFPKKVSGLFEGSVIQHRNIYAYVYRKLDTNVIAS